ncbi:MAG TPA: ABC transporter ATP-binding protein [Jatrophihabitans sp.]|jgi:branched-chain amino acid transport system ATP-binding protein|nr:ABC transporter ATP-binding protein [Jatrophihabitans sp.]
MSALLEVDGLCAGYGRAGVLHDIALRVEPATITAVLGANGAGKTTLLRTLSGLIKPTQGRITFRGADITKVPVEQLVHRGVTHVPEGRGVIAELTVEDNLRLGGLWRRGAAAARETATAVAEVYDLFEPLARRRRAHGHQLSGGERQMLALGRALVARPALMLLDEPSLGLAPPVTAQIMALLRTLRDSTGLALLLVEQNVHSALAVADEALVLAVGKIVVRGPAAELEHDETLRHAYLGF